MSFVEPVSEIVDEDTVMAAPVIRPPTMLTAVADEAVLVAYRTEPEVITVPEKVDEIMHSDDAPPGAAAETVELSNPICSDAVAPHSMTPAALPADVTVIPAEVATIDPSPAAIDAMLTAVAVPPAAADTKIVPGSVKRNPEDSEEFLVFCTIYRPAPLTLLVEETTEKDDEDEKLTDAATVDDAMMNDAGK